MPPPGGRRHRIAGEQFSILLLSTITEPYLHKLLRQGEQRPEAFCSLTSAMHAPQDLSAC